jgi:hypothetical protein
MTGTHFMEVLHLLTVQIQDDCITAYSGDIQRVPLEDWDEDTCCMCGRYFCACPDDNDFSSSPPFNTWYLT